MLKEVEANSKSEPIPESYSSAIIQHLKTKGFPASIDSSTGRIRIRFPEAWEWTKDWDDACAFLGISSGVWEYSLLSGRWWKLFGFGDRHDHQAQLVLAINEAIQPFSGGRTP